MCMEMVGHKLEKILAGEYIRKKIAPNTKKIYIPVIH